MREEEQIKKIKKIRNIIIISIIVIEVILACILMFRPNKSKYSKRSMSDSDKNMYNSRIEKYTNSEIKGIKEDERIRRIINEVISFNINNAEDNALYEHFISIEVSNVDGFSSNDEKELNNICYQCNTIEGEGINNEENLKKSINIMQKIEQKIKSNKKYKVELKYNDGLIYKVIISEEEKNKKWAIKWKKRL